jgi:hypothetical protein
VTVPGGYGGAGRVGAVAEGWLLPGGRGGAGVDGPVSFLSVSTCQARDDKDSIFMHLYSRATVFFSYELGMEIKFDSHCSI